MESEISVVRTIDCQKAEEFLNALQPRSDHFKNLHVGGFPKPTEQHIFRGHEDDHFELIPKALRIGPPHVKLKSRGVWGSVQPNPDAENKEKFVEDRHGMVATGNWKNRDQVSAEGLMLTDFFRFADESGLALPEDSRKFRASLLDPFLNRLSEVKRDEQITNWPPSEILSLMGLAQHYDVPTRLLDWTRSAYTAAYFAARSAAESRDLTVSHLSVWAFNIEAYTVRRETAYPFGNKGNEYIKIITVPTASNPNLHVQRGLFTLYQPKELLGGGRVDRAPLNEVIKPFGVVPLFKRFRLPISEAGALLRLLFLEGISGASIFAGFKGAAEATIEQVYWDWWDRPGDIWKRFPASIFD
ncbi:MAG: FRG domain-containing protein [Pyrinomonadaceae bacterium]